MTVATKATSLFFRLCDLVVRKLNQHPSLRLCFDSHRVLLQPVCFTFGSLKGFIPPDYFLSQFLKKKSALLPMDTVWDESLSLAIHISLSD